MKTPIIAAALFAFGGSAAFAQIETIPEAGMETQAQSCANMIADIDARIAQAEGVTGSVSPEADADTGADLEADEGLDATGLDEVRSLRDEAQEAMVAGDEEACLSAAAAAEGALGAPAQ